MSNGKVIGTREFAYVYKQRFRMPDKREAVIVNKLSVEYRKLKALANGGKDAEVLFNNKLAKEALDH